MSFETQIKVRFNDVDRAGIAYYPTLVGYLHIAFEEFFGGYVQVPYDEVIERQDLGFPAVDVQVSFRAPFRFGDVVTAQVWVAKVGRTSTHFHYVLLGESGAVHMEAKVVVACVKLSSLTTVPIPSPYREAFERAQQDYESRDSGP